MRCDLLLTNATIVTMDERFTVHADGGVAVTGDSIVSVGPEALGYEAAERHDCGGGIVLPGIGVYDYLSRRGHSFVLPGSRAFVRSGPKPTAPRVRSAILGPDGP